MQPGEAVGRGGSGPASGPWRPALSHVVLAASDPMSPTTSTTSPPSAKSSLCNGSLSGHLAQKKREEAL